MPVRPCDFSNDGGVGVSELKLEGLAAVTLQIAGVYFKALCGNKVTVSLTAPETGVAMLTSTASLHLWCSDCCTCKDVGLRGLCAMLRHFASQARDASSWLLSGTPQMSKYTKHTAALWQGAARSSGMLTTMKCRAVRALITSHT